MADTRKIRSLTFYQTTAVQGRHSFDSSYTGGLAASVMSQTVYGTSAITTRFNAQLNGYLNGFNAERDRIAGKVASGLANEPGYTGARDDAVKLAWKMEKADIEMGGKGSSSWNPAERSEILETGKVRGAEGHHIKNVADHPELQGDPDNIKIFKTREAHRQEGHNGNFQNESNGTMIDKNKMLKKTNANRVIKNELTGLGIATAIGVGVGFTIGFSVTLAKSGISPDSIKYALISGGKTGIISGFQSAAAYGIGRTVGELATKALTGMLKNVGITITDDITKMCNMGAVGAITIAIFSSIQFLMLIRSGTSLKEASIQVGKQALFSISLLAVSIAAQGIWGGPAGLIVSISSGIIIITYNIATTVHEKKLSEKIRCYVIEKYEPTFA